MSDALRPLIEAARAGNRQALNSLAGCVDRFVRIHSGSMTRHLRKTYGSTVDFVLEGLAEALSRLAEFEYRSDEQFYSWVSHYIRNRIVDAARQEQAQRRAGRPAPLEKGLNEPSSPGESPSSLVWHDELRAAIKEAIVEVQVDHPREMEAVVLKLFDGLTWLEIRERFDLATEKRARMLVVRGLDLLRPRVKEFLGESTVRDLLGLG